MTSLLNGAWEDLSLNTAENLGGPFKALDGVVLYEVFDVKT